MRRRVILVLLAVAAAAVMVAQADGWWDPANAVCDYLRGWDVENDCAIGVCVFEGPAYYIVVTYLDLDGDGCYSGRGSGEALACARVRENPCD